MVRERLSTNLALVITCVQEPGMEDQGTFALFVTPPAGSSRRFNRNIIFLLDRSGSMTGDPFLEV